MSLSGIGGIPYFLIKRLSQRRKPIKYCIRYDTYEKKKNHSSKSSAMVSVSRANVAQLLEITISIKFPRVGLVQPGWQIRTYVSPRGGGTYIRSH